ncbi:MAG: hypothetical protein COB10_05735 [Planctomycetota bacterium]|nr:MAG: hypothetical protein COB10_05735 [Planctomycetota bacterium]
MNTEIPPATDLPDAGERWVIFFALLLPAVIAFHPLANNDLPMHLAIGDWIIEHGEIPTTDPFSANGHGGTWIAHEWLAALLFAVVYKIAGASGLVALAVALSALLGALQDKIARLLGVPAVARLLLLGPLWLVAGRRLMLRPHLLGLCSVLGLWCITLLGRERPRLLWLAVPLMALWANLHSSFILGIAFLTFDLLIFPDGHRASSRQRIGVLVSSIAATVLQPHGLGLFLFPFQLGLDPVFTNRVMEWVSPFSSNVSAMWFRHTFTFWVGLPLLALALLRALQQGIRHSKGKVPRAARLAIVVAIAMALLQQRHFVLAVLLSSPLLGLWLSHWPRIWPEKMHRARRGAVVVTSAMVLMLLFSGYPASIGRIPGRDIGWRRPGIGWSTIMPRTPITILATEWQVRGAVLCEYEFGSTVVHASGGRLQPTMDSRNTVYGAALFLAHQSAISDGGQLDEELERLLALANAVLIRPPERQRKQLTQRLATDGTWALVHVGPLCQGWVRRTAVPENLRPSLAR